MRRDSLKIQLRRASISFANAKETIRLRFICQFIKNSRRSATNWGKLPFQELHVQRVYFTNKQCRGCKAIVTYNGSIIIKKNVKRCSFVDEHLPAGLYIPRIAERRQRRFRRLTFTILSFLCSTIMTRMLLFPPVSRLRRKERYLEVVFSSDSPPSYLFSRLIASRNNDRFVFAREEKLRRRCYRCSSQLNIYRRRGPSMEIARESKYLCPRYMHISYHVDISFESRVRVLEHLARSRNVATV